MHNGRRTVAGPAAAKPIALMRVAGLKPFVAFLGREHVPVAGLLARSKISPEVFERPESLVPVLQVVRLMEDAAIVRGLDDLGARAGATIPVDALGIFGRQIVLAGVLRTAIETLIRVAPAFDSGGRFWLRRDGDRAWLCHQFRDRLAVTYRQADQYWLMFALNVVRLAAGPSWRPDAVRFESPRASGLDHANIFSGAQVACEQHESAIGFPTSLLDRPLAPPRVGHRADSSDDIDRWSATAPAGEFVESILQLVASQTSLSCPRIDAVADAVGIAVRTLQRRLADAGTTYDQVLARVRFRTAAHLLTSSDATVLDVALDVGYSDHAHFTRAFRRWTGVPPREFRQAHQDMPRSVGLVSGGMMAASEGEVPQKRASGTAG
jgi:AraC-like DNA-binding protein